MCVEVKEVELVKNWFETENLLICEIALFDNLTLTKNLVFQGHLMVLLVSNLFAS